MPPSTPILPLPDASIERVLFILGLIVVGHLLVRGIRSLAGWLLAPGDGGRRKSGLARRHPKVATVTTLLASTLTFVIYFVGIGLILRELDISVTAYFASATVIGLAVGFGSQGLVQDVVTGLTLIFSDVVDVDDVVEVSGQVGRVDSVGLRFTTLVNFLGVRVVVPNRNIAVIGRYRDNVVRVLTDVRVPAGPVIADVERLVAAHATGFRDQFEASVVADPELMGTRSSGESTWGYVRIRFLMWPGQQTLVEGIFVKSMAAALRELDPTYADWMVSVTYRAR